MMQEDRRDKRFNPEKYKMACCPSCRGAGKSTHEEGGAKVCHQCGGFGWIKKENQLGKGGQNESNRH